MLAIAIQISDGNKKSNEAIVNQLSSIVKRFFSIKSDRDSGNFQRAWA